MAGFLLKFAISAVLIWLLVRGFDTATLLDHLANVRLGGLLLATALLASLSAIQAWRWTVIVEAIGQVMTFLRSWQIIFIGLFFNQTLPSAIGGDAVRMWRAYKAGIGMAPAVHSVMLDRLSALAALVLMAAAGLPAIFRLMAGDPARWAVPVLVAGGVGGFSVLMTMDRLPRDWRRWRVAQAAAELSADARRVLLRARVAAPVIAMSVVIQLGVAATVYVLAGAAGIEVGLVDCLILVPPVLLVSMVPISIAGWGVREGAMVTAFGFAGVAADQAFVLSVLFGLVIMVVGLPGGLVWLLSGGGKGEALEPPLTEPAADGGPKAD